VDDRGAWSGSCGGWGHVGAYALVRLHGGRLDNLSDPLTVDGCQRHANFTCRRQTG